MAHVRHGGGQNRSDGVPLRAVVAKRLVRREQAAGFHVQRDGAAWLWWHRQRPFAEAQQHRRFSQRLMHGLKNTSKLTSTRRVGTRRPHCTHRVCHIQNCAITPCERTTGAASRRVAERQAAQRCQQPRAIR